VKDNNRKATPTHPETPRPARASGKGADRERRSLELPADISPVRPDDAFLRAADELGIAFDPGDIDQLALFLGLLMAANERVNLTAIRDAHLAWHRHILDALTLLPLLSSLAERETGTAPDEAGARVVDIGSGGGLPVVPLSLVLPGIAFVAVEATGKKARFLEIVAERLGLDNLTVINDRAEVLARDPLFRESFDAVTARAVGKLAVVAELTVPFAQVGGVVLLVKGERADEELAEGKRALHLLHADHHSTHHTPTGRIVVLSKARPTPKAYPRRTGEPKRLPLGTE
jgi:16S rRNA (guanine527-N7)-methyltransferase